MVILRLVVRVYCYMHSYIRWCLYYFLFESVEVMTSYFKLNNISLWSCIISWLNLVKFLYDIMEVLFNGGYTHTVI